MLVVLNELFGCSENNCIFKYYVVGLAVSRYFCNTVVLESDDTCIVYISVKRYYRCWYYRGFTVSRNSFEARRLVVALLLKTKAWY